MQKSHGCGEGVRWGLGDVNQELKFFENAKKSCGGSGPGGGDQMWPYFEMCLWTKNSSYFENAKKKVWGCDRRIEVI